MRSGKKIIRNYIYNTAYQMLVLLAPLVTTPYISRTLGASGVGIYSYVQSIAYYFVLVGAVGTTLYGQREIASVQGDKRSCSKIFWEITCFRFVSVLACTVVYYLSFGIWTEYAFVFRIMTLEVLATALDVSWFFMGMEEFKVTVIRNCIIKVIGIVLVFIFVKTPKDVGVYTLCMTLPIFIGNLSLWFSLPKYLVKVSISISDVLRHLKPAGILLLPQLATEVYVVLDKTLLGVLASGMDEVGYYTNATKIVKIVLLLVTSLGTVMLPAMSHAFATGQKDLIRTSIRNSFDFAFMLGFALLFGLCGIANIFVPIFFGPGYDKVVMLLILTSPTLILIAATNVIGRQYLLPTRQEKSFTLSVVSGAVVNVIVNLLLIPRFDSIGAAIATVCAEATVLVVQIYAVRRELNLKECFIPAIKYFLCGSIMCLGVVLTGQLMGPGMLTLLAQIVTGIVIYVAEMVIVRAPLLMAVLKH